MPTDVIIDPSTGQIYWNDNTGTPQSISIKGDALNAISVTGYSASFSPGSSVGGTTTLVTFNDNSGTDALVPGTNGFNLGSSTLRWNTFSTNANLSGSLVVSDSTISSSLLIGSARFNGGIAISGNASIGQSLNFYNTAATFYTGFRAGTISANTLYTLPTSFPGSGTSVLQSDTAGTLTWVPMTASSSSGGTVSSGTQYQLAGYYSGTGASVSGSSTFTNNTATGQVQITHTTASFGTSNGALQVAGGVGISGRLSFNQASFGTTGIASLPTMAMIGQTGDPIFMSILEDNSIAFEGSQGQLFSISPNLTTGYIWAVNDISGVPLLRANVNGNVFISEFGGNLGIGQTNPTYKLDLKGNFGLASSNDSLYNFIFSNSAASGSNSLQIRSANSLLLYNSGNTFYTGLKSNAATNVTYTLPTTDGSSGQFLQTNGAGTLTWATATGGGGGSGSTGVNPGGEFEIGYYAATGASISGSSTFKNNTTTGVVSVTHTTNSTNFSSGAFTVSGGVGIGGTLNVGTGASIAGVRITGGAVTLGAWNGTVVGVQYGGTGQNLSGLSGILTISAGTVTNSTTSSAIASALSDETGAGSLVFNSQPSFGTGVTTGDTTFAVFNTNANTINAFGAATTISLGASTGTATFNSANNTTAANTGAVVFSGGVGIGKSVSIGGRLLLFNGSTYTGFVSNQVGTGSTVYTLPTTSPATGSSVLQSTSEGVMSWVPLIASGGAGSGTVAIPGGQYQVAAYYWSATGASVSGSSTFTNNTASAQVAINHNTASTSTNSGALVVSGGLGLAGNAFIGGTLNVPSTSTSNISNVLFANGIVTSGTWSGSTITAFYGGTGLQGPTAIGDIIVANTTSTWSRYAASSNTGYVLTSNGPNAAPTWQAVPPAAASSVAVVPTVVNSQFSITTVNTSNGTGLGLSTVASLVVNPATGIVTVSGLAVTATTQTTSASTGAFIVTNGAAVGQSLSIGGRLLMFNGATNYTAFVSSASTPITYTLPPTAPAGVGSSYLSASTTGVMAWVAAPTGGGGSPGGSNKQIQYNNASAFGGASGFEFTTGGIANTVSIFSASGTGYTAGLWVHAINGSTTRVGIGLSNPAFELEILGEISATNKSFVIDHPTKDGMKLRYGSLEGPENGVYVRGELKNSNIIEVPDHWLGLVHPDTYTVHLTPIGRYAQLYVEKIENYNVYVADNNMNPIHCYYSVWAERKDIPKLITEYEAQ
jgi:hypothetical protein